jgi:PhoH-like ATPase
MTKKKKTFVLDTNVILHDNRSIFNFQDNDVVIPIAVLEELDHFKKGTDMKNFQAREFMRELDRIAGENLFSNGISLGDGRGSIFIETSVEYTEKVSSSFSEKKPDHRILSVADYWKNKYSDRKVILVTQDINLRMKAKSIGVEVQDYETGKVHNIDALYKGITEHEDVDSGLVSKLYKEYEGISVDDFSFKDDLIPNEFFILKSSSGSALAHFNPFQKKIERVEKKKMYGITPRNAEQTFAFDALTRSDIKLVTITGKAGTGKTLLALAAALQQRKIYKQIFLSRPIIPLANRDMGFLPGDAKDKIGPYMQPLFDNLSVIKHQFNLQSNDYARIEEMQKDERLLITPLAYIRGRSLNNVYFIVDEAQNLTPHEVKTIITRAGSGTKMIFTGDIQQIDSPYLDSKSNGLSYLTDKMKGQNIFAHIHLVKGERSELADLASDLL